MDEQTARTWLDTWSTSILATARRRYCDRELGEEIGWLISPVLDGFYQGYLATGDALWVERFADWADAWIRRGIEEPDGYLGWPKGGGASTSAMPDFVTDSLLGEAMALRPLTLMAQTVLTRASLAERYGETAQAWLRLSERTFEKWDRRGCWRSVPEGGVWVVAPFGLRPDGRAWTSGYERRHTDGFSLPANKQNLVARWLLALYDALGHQAYRERAELWFQVMKARLRTHGDGRYYTWNYWDPAGPWDRREDGSLKHWVGVHPNGGYYAVDLEGIAAAHARGLVFTQQDMERLIATNRDFMWDGALPGARFRRLDGGEADPRWKAPGCLWTALLPHDATLRAIFEADHGPGSWGGLVATPWYLAQRRCASG